MNEINPGVYQVRRRGQMSIWREIEDGQAVQQRKSLSEDEILQVMHWILKDEEWPFIWGRDTKEMVCI